MALMDATSTFCRQLGFPHEVMQAPLSQDEFGTLLHRLSHDQGGSFVLRWIATLGLVQE